MPKFMKVCVVTLGILPISTDLAFSSSREESMKYEQTIENIGVALSKDPIDKNSLCNAVFVLEQFVEKGRIMGPTIILNALYNGDWTGYASLEGSRQAARMLLLKFLSNYPREIDGSVGIIRRYSLNRLIAQAMQAGLSRQKMKQILEPRKIKIPEIVDTSNVKFRSILCPVRNHE